MRVAEVREKAQKAAKKISMLEQISERRYFTISEASELCDVKPHVLRYWEQEFSVLKPSKRRGSRRYYQKKDIELILKIRELLYDRGFTIQGARQELKAGSSQVVSQKLQIKQQHEAVVLESSQHELFPSTPRSVMAQHWIPKILQELESVLEELKS